MKTIWKYQVQVDDLEHTVDMPEGARIVHVDSQGAILNVIAFWAEHDSGPMIERHFRVFGTGHPIPDTWEYRGSSLVAGGALVWHLYEWI